MTIRLPEDLETSVRAEVLSGHFASEAVLVAEAVREFLRRHGRAPSPESGVTGRGPDPILGSMRDAAEELDEIVADAMRQRREETWRTFPGE